jgi:hypothetical protein
MSEKRDAMNVKTIIEIAGAGVLGYLIWKTEKVFEANRTAQGLQYDYEQQILVSDVTRMNGILLQMEGMQPVSPPTSPISPVVTINNAYGTSSPSQSAPPTNVNGSNGGGLIWLPPNGLNPSSPTQGSSPTSPSSFANPSGVLMGGSSGSPSTGSTSGTAGASSNQGSGAAETSFSAGGNSSGGFHPVYDTMTGGVGNAPPTFVGFGNLLGNSNAAFGSGIIQSGMNLANSLVNSANGLKQSILGAMNPTTPSNSNSGSNSPMQGLSGGYSGYEGSNQSQNSGYNSSPNLYVGYGEPTSTSAGNYNTPYFKMGIGAPPPWYVTLLNKLPKPNSNTIQGSMGETPL